MRKKNTQMVLPVTIIRHGLNRTINAKQHKIQILALMLDFSRTNGRIWRVFYAVGPTILN